MYFLSWVVPSLNLGRFQFFYVRFLTEKISVERVTYRKFVGDINVGGKGVLLIK
jgi:hypothetical protein